LVILLAYAIIFQLFSGMNFYFKGLFWHDTSEHVMPAKNYCAYSGYWQQWRCSKSKKLVYTSFSTRKSLKWNLSFKLLEFYIIFKL